jgi:hypothetical protein
MIHGIDAMPPRFLNTPEHWTTDDMAQRANIGVATV